MDVDALGPGDFVERIEEAYGSADALIVVIGRQWVSATDATGRRRLDDPRDFVRLEIEQALHKGRDQALSRFLSEERACPQKTNYLPLSLAWQGCSLSSSATSGGPMTSSDSWRR